MHNFINLIFTKAGKVYGQAHRNTPHEKKVKIIENLYVKFKNLSNEVYGKIYFFLYEFIKTVSINEDKIIIKHFIKENTVMELDVTKKTQRQIFLQKPYEKFIREYIEKVLKNNEIFIDIGANVGYYTLLASHLVGDNGGVIAFEPEEENFRSLKNNIHINNLMNIESTRSAVSNMTGEKDLYINPLNEGGHSLIEMGNYRDNKVTISKHNIQKKFPNFKSFEKVKTITLDDYIGKYDAVKKINLIKIDVEGFEHEVIEGMSNLLSKQMIQKIICEVSKINSPIFNILRDAKFKAYLFTKQGPIEIDYKNTAKKGNYLFELIK